MCEGGCGRMVCVKVGGWWVEWCKCMCSAPVNKSMYVQPAEYGNKVKGLKHVTHTSQTPFLSVEQGLAIRD